MSAITAFAAMGRKKEEEEEEEEEWFLLTTEEEEEEERTINIVALLLPLPPPPLQPALQTRYAPSHYNQLNCLDCRNGIRPTYVKNIYGGLKSLPFADIFLEILLWGKVVYLSLSFFTFSSFCCFPANKSRT